MKIIKKRDSCYDCRNRADVTMKRGKVKDGCKGFTEVSYFKGFSTYICPKYKQETYTEPVSSTYEPRNYGKALNPVYF